MELDGEAVAFATTDSVAVQLRQNGALNTTANYSNSYYYNNAGTFTGASSTTQPLIIITVGNSLSGVSFLTKIYNINNSGFQRVSSNYYNGVNNQNGSTDGYTPTAYPLQGISLRGFSGNNFSGGTYNLKGFRP